MKQKVQVYCGCLHLEMCYNDLGKQKHTKKGDE